jgi:hypothetical protein
MWKAADATTTEDAEPSQPAVLIKIFASTPR